MGDAWPHVVIVGGGFGGLEAAKRLANKPVRVTLIDRRNHHLFQPLLYQVATGGLSAAEVAMPIRKVLHKHKNIAVWLADVAEVQPTENQLHFVDGRSLSYDFLIVASGATHSYFGRDDWAQLAPGLKSIEDAFEIRRRIFLAFEMAERTEDPVERAKYLTFLVVGAGPTGVEMAGSIAEIARNTLSGEFRSINPHDARVILIEGLDRVLSNFAPPLSASAQASLQRLGVEVRTLARVTNITFEGVTLDGREHIAARTVLWAAGVRGSPLGATLGATLERNGQVQVDACLRVPAHPNIYVVGDLASIVCKGQRVPGVAQGALQMGRLAAQNIVRAVANQPQQAFVYNDKGSMATIGRSHAVAQIKRLQLTGILAWLAWALVHLMSLIGFRNRMVTLVNWVWAYFTYQRSGRLIFERGQSATTSITDAAAGTSPPPQAPSPIELNKAASTEPESNAATSLG